MILWIIYYLFFLLFGDLIIYNKLCTRYLLWHFYQLFSLHPTFAPYPYVVFMPSSTMQQFLKITKTTDSKLAIKMYLFSMSLMYTKPLTILVVLPVSLLCSVTLESKISDKCILLNWLWLMKMTEQCRKNCIELSYSLVLKQKYRKIWLFLCCNNIFLQEDL